MNGSFVVGKQTFVGDDVTTHFKSCDDDDVAMTSWLQVIPHGSLVLKVRLPCGITFQSEATMPYHFDTAQWALRALYRLPCRITLIWNGSLYRAHRAHCVVSRWYGIVAYNYRARRAHCVVSKWYGIVAYIGPVGPTVWYQSDTAW